MTYTWSHNEGQKVQKTNRNKAVFHVWRRIRALSSPTTERVLLSYVGIMKQVFRKNNYGRWLRDHESCRSVTW